MSMATSEAFLSGQGVAVPLGQVESELTRLWGPAADRAGGTEVESGGANVTRIVLANLVVGSGPGCPKALEATLDTVVARHPCRAIVLCRTERPEPEVFAEVAALCHLPSSDRPQVCSERIVLHAGPAATALVPGAIRPLLEADLPFVLWWPDSPTQSPLFAPLAAEASRLILDLPDPTPDLAELRHGLDLARNPFARDTAWYAITRWRELLAQFFDGPAGAEELMAIRALEVHVGVPEGSAPAPARLGAWLVAWLAGQLGWECRAVRDAGPTGRTATFLGPRGAIEVRLFGEVVPGPNSLPQILRVDLALGGTEADADAVDHLRVTRLRPDAPLVRVDRSSPTACVLPRLVGVAQVDAAGRVAAALEAARPDPPYTRALPQLLRLLAGEAGSGA